MIKILLLFIFSVSAYSFELANILIVKGESSSLHQSLAQVDLSTELKSFVNLNSIARYEYDFNNLYPDKFSFQKLYVEQSWNNFKLSAGKQVVSWSETFGVGLLDVVHARDFRETIFSSDDERLLPAIMLNSEYFFDDGSVQLIFNPKAQSDVFPVFESQYYVLPVRLLEEDDFKYFTDSEYGLKGTYLFTNGFEISSVIYRHFNRIPNFLPIVESNQIKYRNSVEKINTIGVGITYATDSVTFRADTIYRDASNASTASVVAIDFTQNDWTFVSQLYLDDQFKESYFMEQIKKSFEQKFECALSLVKSLNFADYWIKPELSYYPKDNITFSIEANLLGGDKDSSMLGPYLLSDHFKISYSLYF